MSKNKEYTVALLILSVLPIVISTLPTILETKIKGFYASDYNGLALKFVLFSTLGPIYILYRNSSSKSKVKVSNAWNIGSVVLGICILTYWYLGYSISNIGF